MLEQLESQVVSGWHSPKPAFWARLASMAFGLGVGVRRAWYVCLPKSKPKVPVLVVGNITVGGSGKTPVVIAMAQALAKMGYMPGIVSRGYKASMNRKPTQVNVYHTPQEVGDEPLLIHLKTGMPTIICKNRSKAVKFLCAQNPQVNVIISDDGLQHYSMARTKEIALVEMHGLGNQWLLPAGPLREPISRLKSVDYRLSSDPRIGDFQIQFHQSRAVKLDTGEVDLGLESFKGRKVHGVAGIANPERFFSMLEAHGISVIRHVFADHHEFCEEDLDFDTTFPILMTEKDAIKCQNFKGLGIWSVELKATLDPKFIESLVKDINRG